MVMEQKYDMGGEKKNQLYSSLAVI